MQTVTGAKVRVAGHRGHAALFPENTLPAFESAMKLPIDMVEFDLHMTLDKEIIVMHDPSLNRTTNGSGPIREHTLGEIKRLDAGAWKGEGFKGVAVPTFSELLELAKSRPDMFLNVELKDYPAQDEAWAQESADRAISLIWRYGVEARCIINSFSASLLEYVDEKYGRAFRMHGFYPLELMGEKRRDPLDYLYCACLLGTKEAPVPDKAAFDFVLSRGVEPWVYYSNDAESSYEKAAQNGAMLITANDPEKALRFLRAKGLHE